jgi:hypothetical protein
MGRFRIFPAPATRSTDDGAYPETIHAIGTMANRERSAFAALIVFTAIAVSVRADDIVEIDPRFGNLLMRAVDERIDERGAIR